MKNFLIALSFLAPAAAYADYDINGASVTLYSCNSKNKQIYGRSINDIPGKCSPLPAVTKNWSLILVDDNKMVAQYVDLSTLKHDGEVASISVLMLLPSINDIYPDSGKLPDHPDMIVHIYFDCVNMTSRIDEIYSFINYRIIQQPAGSFIDRNRPAIPIADDRSSAKAILDFVCSK
jgi:hypothetical protein